MKNLCINCAHHRHSDRMIKNESYERCDHPDVIDPVTGEAASCYMARGRDGSCGVGWRYFLSNEPDRMGQQQENTLVGLIYRREDGVEMSEPGEDCLEMWTVRLLSDGDVKLRQFRNGMVCGSYRRTSRELAMLDMVAILQGLQPLRYLRRPDKLPDQTPVAHDDHQRDKHP